MGGKTLDGIEITVSRKGPTLVLELRGFIDAANADEFKKAVLEEIKPGDSTVELNVSELTYACSSALAFLAGLRHKFLGEGRELIMVNPGRGLRGFLEATGLNRLFNVSTQG